jgi:uncharacterized protein DUF4261
METFFFTQCAAVLFDQAPRLEDVERAIGSWDIAGRPNEGSGEHGWALSGPGFMVALRSGAFGVVDVVGRPWPDDPRLAETVPAIGAAWRSGAFGRATSTPGALARAADQPWAWDGAAAAASGHGAFVRLRTGHATQPPSEDDPEGRNEVYEDPTYELMSLTEMAQPLLRLPGALALFVPAGEALRSKAQTDAALERKVGEGGPPFELWTNVRAVALGQEGDLRWLALDVIGMTQLRLPDLEALFAEGQEEPEAVEALLRNACLHMASGKPIPPGVTADDGRGRRWKTSAARGIVAPPRPVVRWLPEESARPTEATLTKLSSTG